MNEKNLSDIRKIRSKYIRIFVFKFLSRKNILDIVKYNKCIKKELNIDLNTYKFFNAIEIEITTVENSYEGIINYGELSSNDQGMIHFIKNKKEKDLFFDNDDLIDTENKITIYIEKTFSDLSYFFKDCNNIKKIIFKKFRINTFDDMSYMFFNCENLESINFLEFDTSNVRSFFSMFGLCTRLKVLDLSKFNTNNALDMGYMFYKCTNLISINLKTFNTEKVLRMQCMFCLCSSIKIIDLFWFDTSKVFDMKGMFALAYSLEEVKFSNLFKIKTSTNYEDFFYLCFSLKRTNLTCLNNNNKRYRDVIFYGSCLLPQINRDLVNEKINTQ